MDSMITLGAYVILAALSGVISARAFRLYRASDHTGIKYFWLAFLGFGIAFLAQATNQITSGLWWTLLLTLAFRYAAITGLLALVFSMQWREFPKSRDWIRHAAALAVTLVSLWRPAAFPLTALLIVGYGLIQSHSHHQERGTKSLQLYFIAFSLATLAVVMMTLVAFFDTQTLTHYGLGLLIMIFGFVLIGSTRVGGRG